MTMADGKTVAGARPKITRVEVYWHTVKYRTVILLVLTVLAIIGASCYLIFPEFSAKTLQRISDAVAPRDNGGAAAAARQARFVNLDGKVQIKKVNSLQWVNADYQITLDKGDEIETGSDGVARVSFADGTEYTVKGDTFVTVEENTVAQDHATQVAVHLNTGQVDLNTGTWPVPGSKAEVSFQDAVADAQANSRLNVRSDPTTNEQQVTVDAGSAELNRGSEHVDIGQYERASFTGGGGAITKTQVLAPPQLTEPLNLQPIIVADPQHDPVHFAWNPSATAKEYDLQASTTTSFAHIVIERRTAATSVDIPGFEPGDYFWRVRAIDDKNNISDPSDSYKFTLVAQGKEQEMVLDVDGTELQGNVVEVIGRTEPGAALIINGEEVADIQSDGHFRYFTPPMARGSHTIVITGQNRRGGTAIKRVDVVIP
ncbi:MAG TPA: FecR domain-containing protein [Candidatus Baltobacteraceae bacterium]|nr:FecR domain-containing protein [Candidatus Baltobacteraceae bacterium]